MQCKDIPDEAVFDAARAPGRTLDVLIEMTGAPEKVAFRKLERWDERGVLNYGVSLATAWLEHDLRGLSYDEIIRRSREPGFARRNYQ